MRLVPTGSGWEGGEKDGEMRWGEMTLLGSYLEDSVMGSSLPQPAQALVPSYSTKHQPRCYWGSSEMWFTSTTSWL